MPEYDGHFTELYGVDSYAVFRSIPWNSDFDRKYRYVDTYSICLAGLVLVSSFLLRVQADDFSG